jgi:hypothetical protein
MKRWIAMDHKRFEKAASDSFPDISKATEYKDVPITFTLHDTRGRELQIKIVEPEMDYPLPENDRLVVAEKDTCLTDVVFRFNPESDRPYELYFKVLKGVFHATDHVVAFGTTKEDDPDLRNQYDLEIVARGNVKAWIKMTQSKARVAIKYER